MKFLIDNKKTLLFFIVFSLSSVLVIKKDASSKIFLNDQIVSNQIIKKVFINLLEIQTQNEKNNYFSKSKLKSNLKIKTKNQNSNQN